ncbi:hypothetical protein [Actinomyces vulturis]|uniref:hypothetical protein n=1 Tax=Actinomyces vulturis TaxID=1857645 RepID=UPI00082AD404|nr:hypothetical protein [Actinomyces vulturis]
METVFVGWSDLIEFGDAYALGNVSVGPESFPVVTSAAFYEKFTNNNEANIETIVDAAKDSAYKALHQPGQYIVFNASESDQSDDDALKCKIVATAYDMTTTGLLIALEDE